MAALPAVTAFRQQGWATDALTLNAILRVEMQLPPVVHEVPLKAVERWLRSPSASPKEEMAKRAARTAPESTRNGGLIVATSLLRAEAHCFSVRIHVP